MALLGVLLPAVTGMDYIVEKEFFLLFFHLVEVDGGFDLLTAKGFLCLFCSSWVYSGDTACIGVSYY